MSRTITATFREVSARRRVKLPCRNFGKLRARTIKEFQTLNPWNRNAAREPKTAAEIRAELPADLDRAEARLRERGITCRTCQAAALAEGD